MKIRRRSVRLRIALLVLAPLLFLLGFFGYSVTTSVGTALALTRAQAMTKDLVQPIFGLQRALTQERAQAVVYYVRPTPGQHAALERAQAAADRAEAAFRAAARSESVRQSASAAGKRAISVLSGGLAQLPGLRARVQSRSVSLNLVFSSYNNVIAASYDVLEQAVISEGDSAQVLPGIAVIELAISGEYAQQESALLDGDFAAGRFPASAHRAFVSLVGAHRLLYAQSWHYLTPADRGYLQQDLSPRLASTLTTLENAISARTLTRRPPAASAAAWNATVTAYSAQIQRAVGQSLALLATNARSQANTKIRSLYLAGGLGLAAVVLSVAISLLLASNLARRLAGLRDDALELANVQLPSVVRRLREGEAVDVAAEVPPLAAGPDEIGQVKTAFNVARRTAVEAAVDEAAVRRGVSDVFRNLARRSQSLLHRQMALLDNLERRENEPDSLESLYRIDHLTTRMRRHAESLIVLAGDAPQRGWRNPVPFVDVLRAAAAEVEDYTRVKVITNTPAALAGPAVADVIHLIAELAENGTLFSPQHTQVVITGELVGRGYAVEIEDRGLGLDDDEMADLNDRLADPPPFDLSGSDQLGIFVTAKLAKRHGIEVSLRRSPYGGVIAIVLIPQPLVVTPGAIDFDDLPSLPSNGRLTIAGRHAVRGASAGDDSWPGANGAFLEPASHDAQPVTSGWQAAGKLPSLASDGAPDLVPQAQPAAEELAASGHRLPQRVRQASLAPQLRTASSPSYPDSDGPETLEPESARRVGSAFQRHWRAGLADPATPPDPGAGPGAQEGASNDH